MLNDNRYPQYDKECMSEVPVPKNPQAPMDNKTKSPIIERPVTKRNKPSISGRKGT